MTLLDELKEEHGILHKIALARRIWERYGRTLASDRELANLLQRYDQEIRNTHHLMRKARLVEICSYCAAHTPGGSCCGKGIEEWYEVPVLLFNLMMGREIITDPPGPKDCLFLGPQGCRLWARHHFCVNYLCHRIHGCTLPLQVEKLQAQAGKELFLCWELERLLFQKLAVMEKQGLQAERAAGGH